MGAAVVPLLVASTAVSIIGQRQQAEAAGQAADFNAKIAENNAVIAEKQALDALKRGRVSERQARVQTEVTKGRQRAALAKSGAVVDEGSALDILLDTAEFGELDALTIRSNAEREAFGFRARGADFTAQAGLTRMEGAAAKRASRIGQFSTLLTGASAVGSRFAPKSGGSTSVFGRAPKTTSNAFSTSRPFVPGVGRF